MFVVKSVIYTYVNYYKTHNNREIKGKKIHILTPV